MPHIRRNGDCLLWHTCRHHRENYESTTALARHSLSSTPTTCIHLERLGAGDCCVRPSGVNERKEIFCKWSILKIRSLVSRIRKLQKNNSTLAAMSSTDFVQTRAATQCFRCSGMVHSVFQLACRAMCAAPDLLFGLSDKTSTPSG